MFGEVSADEGANHLAGEWLMSIRRNSLSAYFLLHAGFESSAHWP